MNEAVKAPEKADETPITGLELLRAPFPAHQVSKLPKGTKEQNQCPAAEKRNCQVCGGWHHPRITHLDYVGHAALTDRLLDADPQWSWEPVAYGEDGLPKFDASGGLWIKLTVAGVTRLGYGHAESSNYKEIGSREKEVIGDALRNAAMRFGAALDLWHKGDLHGDQENEQRGATPEREALTPANKDRWLAAKASFIKNGNLKNVLAAVDMSPEHQAQLQAEVLAERENTAPEPEHA